MNTTTTTTTTNNTIKPAVGKKFKTRDGRTAVIRSYVPAGHPWVWTGSIPDAGYDFISWRDDGTQSFWPKKESDLDLIEEIVEAPALRIAVGKKFRTRDGTIIEITGHEPDYKFPWVSSSLGGAYDHNWRDDGTWGWSPTDVSSLDLVEEIVEEEYPTTPPEPGTGYRLLRKGDPIIRGKAEAWHPDTGWHLGPVRGWDGDTFDPDTDYWFREPVEEAGEGWRFVQPGEEILEGDEWVCTDGSSGPTSIGGLGYTLPAYGVDPLRRRIVKKEEEEEESPAKPGWRLLEAGEIIRDGDEVFEDGSWLRREILGFPVREYSSPHRRRIAFYGDA